MSSFRMECGVRLVGSAALMALLGGCSGGAPSRPGTGGGAGQGSGGAGGAAAGTGGTTGSGGATSLGGTTGGNGGAQTGGSNGNGGAGTGTGGALTTGGTIGSGGVGVGSGGIGIGGDPGAEAVQITAGSGHACVLTAGGAVECWTDGSGIAAAPVAGLTSGVTGVSMGGDSFGDANIDSFACATTGGAVECWGEVYSDESGALGNDSTTASSVPSVVTGLTGGVTSVSAGAGDGLSVCAVTSGGSVWCWGNNSSGQLGNGTSLRASSVPVQITGFPGVVEAVSMGGTFACAITTGGGVWCWGNNADGQLGDNSTTNSLAPVQVSGLASGVTSISTGGAYACAIITGGAVECWGVNTTGQLGNNSTTNSSIPVQVTGLTSGVTALSSGNGASCVVTAGGGVSCWGYNVYGELGNNSTINSVVPVQVTTLTSGVTAVSMGNGFACAVTAGGGVSCWGGSHSSVPVHVTGFPG
jgi:alpha-tubulin suppressor-like RCC1 family protein